jgi:hypothetical protein
MNEVLDTTMELTFADWDDPREQLHQYIIGPEPYPDDHYDEGEGD